MPGQDRHSLLLVRSRDPRPLSPVVVFTRNVGPVYVVVRRRGQEITYLRVTRRLQFPYALIRAVGVRSVQDALINVNACCRYGFVAHRYQRPRDRYRKRTYRCHLCVIRGSCRFVGLCDVVWYLRKRGCGGGEGQTGRVTKG